MPKTTRQSLAKNSLLILLGMLIAVAITQRGAEQPVSAGVATPAAGQTVIEVLPEAHRGGFDPLATFEQEQAGKIALQWLGLNRGKIGPNPAVPADQQLEVLRSERHEESKAVYASGGWARRADVLVYDYARNTLAIILVNLDTRRVESGETATGVQPPLSARETSRALAIVLDDPLAGPAIRGQYQQATASGLSSAAQLQTAAFVFYPDPTASAIVLAAQCGAHRCAQLLLSSAGGLTLSAEPIVDLSTGRFVSLNK
jgi:hypothetical protein